LISLLSKPIQSQSVARQASGVDETRLVLKRLLNLGLVLALASCATPFGVGGQNLTLGAPGLHVAASVYETRTLGPDPTLVVVLHGDAPIVPPTYQNSFAASVARHADNVVAAGLLRPGYADLFGHRSEPRTGPAIGNNYTASVDRQMAAAIEELKARYHPARTLLVGHSGGAAVVANLLERHPGLADGAVIVSCPCDLAAWRARMARFGRPHSHADGLSPLDHVSDLPRAIPITIMVGAKDNTVGVANSQTFYDAAKAAGAQVSLVIVPGAGHMMLGSPAALNTVLVMAGTRHDGDAPRPQS
jgi:pimeloyl-ACP methyl ester carboxylesterase